LKGLPEVVANVWPLTTVQTCILHYADLGIMPTWWREPLVAALWLAGRSA
jgi:transposase-like protein